MKNGWVQTKGAIVSSKLFIRSRYEYLEIKAEMLISRLIFIFWCQTQMFSVYSKNKGIGLTVPIILEGSVYIITYVNVFLSLSMFCGRYILSLFIEYCWYSKFLHVEFISILLHPYTHIPADEGLLLRLPCPDDELWLLWLRRHPAPNLHEPFRKSLHMCSFLHLSPKRQWPRL